MNDTTLAQTRVGKIVARQPAVARIFEKNKIDYCCRGNTSLADACAQQNVDVNEMIAEIERIEGQGASGSESEPDWNEVSLSELADHIVETHHRFLDSELPRITGLVEKVNNAHGDRRPELSKVVLTFKLLREELESHMAKEERILFPAIKLIEANSGPQEFPFGSVANPISMMEHEHDDAGNGLRRLRELTEDFVPPADACPTYRVMLESLENLEQDLHLHIHKENNILFPRAQELERTVSVN